MFDDPAHEAVALELPDDDAGRKRTSIYQPEQSGLIFPEMPDFATVEDERRYRKQHLVAACRAFAMHGFDYGFAGQTRLDEVTGGSPYGATTIAGADGSRQVSQNELDGARYQGRKVAETGAKLTA